MIYLSSLCLYFIRTVPVFTSTMQIEFPPQVATFEVVFVWSFGSGSKTTSQIYNKKLYCINVNMQVHVKGDEKVFSQIHFCYLRLNICRIIIFTV